MITILLFILVLIAILAFVTLPAAVKAAVESSVKAELANVEQTAFETIQAAKDEIRQLEADAKDIVDKARADLPKKLDV
jgi:ABC-type transporter MlaC component